jgi:hypothetical protein
MTKCGFLGGKDAIEALRSSGYRDTSMAIGELIDNSIQAQAKDVKIVLTVDEHKGLRTTTRIATAAVIDNGIGMMPEKLQRALVLGEGTNHNESTGMGKFGVGLPMSSISQATRIDAWSWTEGIKKARHVYIDIEDEAWINEAEIIEPDNQEIPNEYVQFVKDYVSGTIIQWRGLDRFDWKKPSTVFKNVEMHIGRMYRYWLMGGDVSISLVTISETGKNPERNDFRAIDPLFLMKDAYCGNPPETPMFTAYGDDIVRTYKILTKEGGVKETKVSMKFSVAKDSILPNEDMSQPGRTEYGKIALANMGISIVRENRELELTDSWGYSGRKDPRHRWWGAEVSFSRDLDDIFGVTNNKQSATKLNEIAKKTMKEIMNEHGEDSDGDGDLDLKFLEKEDPDTYILVDVVTNVLKRIEELDKHIDRNARKRKQKVTRYSQEPKDKIKYDIGAEKSSHDPDTQSETDKRLLISDGDRYNPISKILESNSNYTDEDKKTILEDVEKKHRCTILVSPTDSSAFFNVETVDTQVVIKLNQKHPAYNSLFGIYDEILDENNNNVCDIKIMARDAFETVYLMLETWARMEDEALDQNKKSAYRKTREKWGEVLERFLIIYDEDN